MSVTTSKRFRTAGRVALPMLVPLWNAAQESFLIRAEGTYTCGSASDDDMVVKLEGVADLHCRLHFRNGQLSIQKAAGRVWINDLPVNSDATVDFGDIVSIGPASFRIETLGVTPQPEFTEFVDASNDVFGDTPSQSSSVSNSSAGKVNRESALAVDELRQLKTQVDEEAARHQLARSNIEASLSTLERQLAELAVNLMHETHTSAEINVDDAEAAKVVSEVAGRLQGFDQILEQRFEKLDAIEERIQSRLLFMEHRETQVAATEQNLLQRLQEIQQAQERLTDSDRNALHAEHELELKRLQVQSRELELNRLEEELQNRLHVCEDSESVCAEQAKLLEQSAQRLVDQEHALEERLLQLEHRELELQQKLNDHESLRRQLDEERAELSDEQNAAQSFRSNLEELEQELAQKAESLRQSAADADDRFREIREQEARLQSEQTLIADHNQKLLEQADRIAELDVALEQRESRYAEMLSDIEAREQTLQSGEESLLTATNSELAELKAALADLLVVKEQLELELSQKSNRIVENDSLLESMRAQLLEKEEALEIYATAATTAVQNESEVRSESVKELAAVAAEREALLREKEQIQKQTLTLEDGRKQLDWQLNSLNKRSEELEARGDELAMRVQEFKRLASRQKSSAAALDQAQILAMAAISDRIDQDNVELNQALAESTEQLEQLANLRSELEQKVRLQNQRNAELEERSIELHGRLQSIKRWAKSPGMATADNQEVDSESHALEIERLNHELTLSNARETELADQIDMLIEQFKLLESSTENQSSQVAQLTAERDSLLETLKNLQASFEEFRDELDSASVLKAELAELQQRDQQYAVEISGYQSRTQQLLSDIETSREQLNQSTSRIAALEELVAELQEAAVPSSDAGGGHSAAIPEPDDCPEAGLLHEVEAIRAELDQSLADANTRATELENLLSEREFQLQQLRDELLTLEASQNKSAAEEDGLPEIAELKEQLEVRDALVGQLRDQLKEFAKKESLAASEITEDSLRLQSRELDQRAVLLDQRDAELKAFAYRLEVSGEELEAQRRQMLEARQQLEIARAEIQIAMQQGAVQAHSSNNEAAEDLSDRFGQADVYQHGSSTIESHDGFEGNGFEHEPGIDSGEDESSGHLRSELASLFGLKPKERKRDDETKDSSDQFLDPSEPSAGTVVPGVSISFENSSQFLLQEPVVDESVSDSEQTPDFVTNYMEELLSRSRTAAGTSLPSELQKSGSGNSSRSEENKESSRQFQQKSFIEQYMSGGSLEEISDPEVKTKESPAPGELGAPRVRIDRDKLRASMDSFRNVSTLSVENALTVSAKKKERSGIYGRIIFIVTLAVLSILQIVLTLGYGFWEPYVLAASVLGMLGTGIELAAKMFRLNTQFHGVLSPQSKWPTTENMHAEEPKASVVQEETPEADLAVDTAAPVTEPGRTVDLNHNKGDSAEAESESLTDLEDRSLHF